MTPRTPFYLIVGVAFCVAAIVLAALNLATDIKWIQLTVQFGQDAGGLLFLAIALLYFIWEGATVLAERYKREQFEKGQAQAMAEALEADRQRKPGETLEEAIKRIRAEKSQSR